MLCPSERLRTPGDKRIPGVSRAEKENPMNHIDDKEAIELLRKAGWTALEIERLRRLRREYAEKERDRASQDHRRPGFAGWLATFLQEELRYFSFWGW